VARVVEMINVKNYNYKASKTNSNGGGRMHLAYWTVA